MVSYAITCTDDTCWGVPRLKGTRLSVEAVVGRFVAGETIAELAEDYMQPPEAIEAMVRAVCRAAYGSRGIYLPVYRRLQAQATGGA